MASNFNTVKDELEDMEVVMACFNGCPSLV
jgi:carbon monoxide dehydrogenase subunit G